MLKSDVEKIRGIFGFLVEKYLSSKFYDSLVEYGQLSLGKMNSNGRKMWGGEGLTKSDS